MRGLNEEFISAPKLNNLVSVYAGLLGLVEGEDPPEDQINIFVGFDNEEIRSATKQGADSNYLANVLERIVCDLGYTRSEFCKCYCSFLLSADGGSHDTSSIYALKSDPTNLNRINEGVG